MKAHKRSPWERSGVPGCPLPGETPATGVVAYFTFSWEQYQKPPCPVCTLLQQGLPVSRFLMLLPMM